MRRHDLDPVALGFGLLFVVFGVGYLAVEATDLHVGAAWALPLALVGFGLAGLAGTVAGRGRGGQG